MRRVLLASSLVLPLAFSLACGQAESPVAIPVLADVSFAQSDVGLVDRETELAEAVDYDLATAGSGIDMRNAGQGFTIDFNGQVVVETGEAAEVPPPALTHFQAAWGGVVAADLFTLAVVGPPRLAIGVAAAGTVTEVQPNVWNATNTVDINGLPVTANLTVAWVGVGWLAEMRITDPVNGLHNAKWFSGFLAVNGAVGWWDLYDGHGTHTGVVEWIGDGQGQGQFGIVATAGDAAGSALSYTFDRGTARVDHYDAATAQDSWVFLDTDQSGEVRLPDHNAGEVGCWDTALADAPCPE
ncbi:MAG: hypothetical protein KC912_21150 [Proteobacteria bacterium]|nr:hypothetical protein [Pseudomonadota bacterium]